jgi:hypothetical protein
MAITRKDFYVDSKDIKLLTDAIKSNSKTHAESFRKSNIRGSIGYF